MNRSEQHALFDRWMSEHPGILHRVASGFAEGADRNDLMQELMLAVWKSVPAFAGGSQPSTFIYRVAHNAALTWKRGRTTYQRHVDRFERATVEAPPGEERLAGRDREMLAFLYAEIRRLPPVDRSLLLLHLDRVGYAEIAGIHGLTEGSVGVRLTRLKQKLTAALEEISHELR